MKKEFKYFYAVSFLFVASVLVLSLLFRKYALLTYGHFIETCKTVASTLFNQSAHLIGFSTVTLTLIVAAIFLFKTVLSIIKTQKSLRKLKAYHDDNFPEKLESILKAQKIRKDRLFLVKNKSDIALSAGTIVPKIILSTGLVERLGVRELEAVILHELHHAQNKHPLLLLAGEIISSTLFFLPIMRDLSKKMRGVIEAEADLYVFSNQKTEKFLDLALLKVKPEGNFSYYPTFGQRRIHRIKKRNVAVSLLVSIISIGLLFLPVRIDAKVALNNDEAEINCGENQCSTHCLTEYVHKDANNFSPTFQTTLSSFSSH